ARAVRTLHSVPTRRSSDLGTRSGEYYAAIVLPTTFSADMMTFYANNGDRTRIDYYLNEKKNALAPKITGQGASEVTKSINEVFRSEEHTSELQSRENLVCR